MSNNNQEYDFSGLEPVKSQGTSPAHSEYDFTGLEPAITPEEPVSQKESILRGAVQGGTLGLSDEAKGAYQNYKGALKALIGLLGKDVSGDSDVAEYKMARDAEREANKKAKEANPKSYVGGELGGGLLTSFVPGGAATTLGKAVTLGGVAGAGMSDADLTKGENVQAIKDSAIGAGTGAIGYKVGEKLSDLISKKLGGGVKSAADSVRRDSGDTALGAVGIDKKMAEKELGAGKGLLVDPEFRKGIGQEAVNNLHFTGGSEGIRERVNKGISDIINEKQPLLQQANDELQKQIQSGSVPLPSVVNDSLENQLKNVVNQKLLQLEQTELNSNVITAFKDRAYDYINRVKGKDLDITDLDNLRKQIGAALQDRPFQQPDRNLGLEDSLLRDAYHLVKNRIEKLADSASPMLGQKIKALNAKESNLLDLSRLASSDAAKDLAKKGGSFGDFAAFGIGTSLTGSPIGGLVTVGGKKAVEKATGFDLRNLGKIAIAKGEQRGANIGDALGNTLQQYTPEMGRNTVIPALANKDNQQSLKDLSKTLYDASNETLNSVVQKLHSVGFSDQGSALQKAIEAKDNQKKNSILFSIMQDPNKRKLFSKEE